MFGLLGIHFIGWEYRVVNTVSWAITKDDQDRLLETIKAFPVHDKRSHGFGFTRPVSMHSRFPGCYVHQLQQSYSDRVNLPMNPTDQGSKSLATVLHHYRKSHFISLLQKRKLRSPCLLVVSF